LIVRILEHNALDILSLGLLTAILGRLIVKGDVDEIPVDPLALARIAEQKKDWPAACRQYRMFLERGVSPALERQLLPKLARLYQRSGDHVSAVWAWEELLVRTRGLALGAYEELARLSERRLGDREAARRWCLSGLEVFNRGFASLGGRVARLGERLRRRLRRLDRTAC